MGSAAASLWLQLATTQPDARERLTVWRRHVGSGPALAAATYLDVAARAELLDACLSALLSEPDLLRTSEDPQKLAVEHDLDDDASGVPAPPALAADLNEHYQWTRLLERRWPRIIGGVRDDLASFVGCVVTRDSLDGVHRGRGARIVRLLEGARERPFLALVAAWYLRAHRPAAIPILLLHHHTRGFALEITSELHIATNTWIGRTAEQIARRDALLRVVWHDAASIALRALVTEANGDLTTIARGIVAVVGPLARRASRVPAHEIDLELTRDATARLDETLQILAGLEAPYRISGQSRVLPLVLSRLVDELVAVGEHSARVPHHVLRLLFWLLDNTTADGDAALVAAAAISAARDVLERPRDGWHEEHAALASLQWGRVAAAVAATDIERLLRPVPPGVESDPRYQANRERLQLRLMLRAHRDGGSRHRHRIETEIVARLAAGAHRDAYDPANLFERTFVGSRIGHDADDLARETAESIDAFDYPSRQQALRTWLAPTADAAMLTTALAAMHTSAARDLIAARLAQLDPAVVLVRESTATIARMVEDTLGAGLVTEAQRILAAGDILFSNPRIQRRWRDDTVRGRLALHAANHDVAAFEALEASSSTPHPFQRGLIALASQDGDKAVDIFRSLVEARPAAADARVNLFVARLAATDTRHATDRPEAIESALREWRAGAAQLQPADLRRVAAVSSYTELRALAALRRDSELDALLAGLEPPLRYRREVADVVVSRRIEAGDTVGAGRFLVEARLHNGPEASWIDKLQEELALGLGTQRLPAVPQPERRASATELRAHVLEAQSRTPEERAEIFGGSAIDLEDLLVQLHIESAEDMLELEATVALVADEDKRNHLFAKLTTARMKALAFIAAEGTPGGLSDGTATLKGHAGGEGWRDWTIQAHDRTLCIVEALRLREPLDHNKIREHVNKIGLYDAIGCGYALVVAYVERPNFDKTVATYHKIITSATLDDLPLITVEAVRAGRGRWKRFRSIHRRDDQQVIVHHLLVALPAARSATPSTP